MVLLITGNKLLFNGFDLTSVKPDSR